MNVAFTTKPSGSLHVARTALKLSLKRIVLQAPHTESFSSHSMFVTRGGAEESTSTELVFTCAPAPRASFGVTPQIHSSPELVFELRSIVDSAAPFVTA